MEQLQAQFFEYKGQVEALAAILKNLCEEITDYQQQYRIEAFASGILEHALQMRTKVEDRLKNVRFNLSEVEKKLEEVRLK